MEAIFQVFRSSPRPWGCFPVVPGLRSCLEVFPTPVGVFLKSWKGKTTITSLPHARGGVSSFYRLPYQTTIVFPTPVGVFLNPVFPYRNRSRLPHARGGVSNAGCISKIFDMSSPRPWGCFPEHRCGFGRSVVFPTPVGVFPTTTPITPAPVRLPHARGGVSMVKRHTHPTGNCQAICRTFFEV